MTESKSKATLEVAGSKSFKVKVGEVVSLAVKASGARPTFRVQGQDRPLYAARDESTGAWAASWVPNTAGVHEARVEAGDAAPVTFTITAAPQED